jgi:hypothetical protein
VTVLLIDSGIDTRADLTGLLPPAMRSRIEPELLAEAPNASALRVLATIRDPRWHAHVHPARIDWPALLEWARARPDGPANSVRVRLEIAASLAGHPGAHVQLLYAARVLDRANYLAVLDALRIAVEGISA